MNDGQKKQNSSADRIFTIPNMLSFFRICLIPVIVWLYLVKKNYTWTVCILILSGLTDMVDGFIARRFNMVSNLGKVLDPIADKLTQAVMLVCLFTRFPMMLVPLVLMLVRELFMGVTGLMIIKKTGNVLGACWHGKMATCLLYVMMILHVFWYDIPALVSDFAITACILIVAFSFGLYGVRNMKILKQSGKEKRQTEEWERNECL